jgi:DNA-binding NarL/FixJ family response regulator
VTLSPFLADLVASVLQPHLPLEVIGVLQTRESLPEKLRQLEPDLIVLGLESGEADSCARPLLAALPSAQILVLEQNGRHAWLYRMRPHRTALANVSMPSLIRALSPRFRVSPPKNEADATASEQKI